MSTAKHGEYPVTRLDNKGRCPNCLVKPLKYTREPHFFCHRCDRAFDLNTEEMIDNWAWSNGERRPKTTKGQKIREPEQ